MLIVCFTLMGVIIIVPHFMSFIQYKLILYRLSHFSIAEVKFEIWHHVNVYFFSFVLKIFLLKYVFLSNVIYVKPSYHINLLGLNCYFTCVLHMTGIQELIWGLGFCKLFCLEFWIFSSFYNKEEYF